jgi:hypothetical protein
MLSYSCLPDASLGHAPPPMAKAYQAVGRVGGAHVRPPSVIGAIALDLRARLRKHEMGAIPYRRTWGAQNQVDLVNIGYIPCCAPFSERSIK